jgi:hypothetical protein
LLGVFLEKNSFSFQIFTLFCERKVGTQNQFSKFFLENLKCFLGLRLFFSFGLRDYFLFGKEKKALRWLVFPTENLFLGKTQKRFLLGLLFSMKVAEKTAIRLTHEASRQAGQKSTAHYIAQKYKKKQFNKKKHLHPACRASPC